MEGSLEPPDAPDSTDLALRNRDEAKVGGREEEVERVLEGLGEELGVATDVKGRRPKPQLLVSL